MKEKRLYETIKLYRYYAVIVILSLTALIFLPALKVSNGEIEFNFPKTQLEWFIWGTSRACVMLISLIIFVSFVNQGKLRAARTPEYKKANNIMIALALVKPGEKKDPINPRIWERTTKAKKSVRLIFNSTLSFVAFGQLILGFDIMTFFSYLWVIGSAGLFGFLTMVQSEDVWSVGYLEYAEWRQQKYEMESKSQLEVKIEPTSNEMPICNTNTQTEEKKPIEKPKKSLIDMLMDGGD